MTDWLTIAEISREHELSRTDHEFFYNKTKNRINRILGHAVVNIGLNDVGLDKNEILHGGNVMMPKDTTDLDNPKICLIDQPAKGLQGKLMLALLKVRK